MCHHFQGFAQGVIIDDRQLSNSQTDNPFAVLWR